MLFLVGIACIISAIGCTPDTLRTALQSPKPTAAPSVKMTAIPTMPPTLLTASPTATAAPTPTPTSTPTSAPSLTPAQLKDVPLGYWLLPDDYYAYVQRNEKYPNAFQVFIVAGLSVREMTATADPNALVYTPFFMVKDNGTIITPKCTGEGKVVSKDLMLVPMDLAGNIQSYQQITDFSTVWRPYMKHALDYMMKDYNSRDPLTDGLHMVFIRQIEADMQKSTCFKP